MLRQHRLSNPMNTRYVRYYHHYILYTTNYLTCSPPRKLCRVAFVPRYIYLSVLGILDQYCMYQRPLPK